MLDQSGFDQWADDYDKTVELSNAEDSYPFAGYGEVLDRIERIASAGANPSVLDVGFGTGNLTQRLYRRGCEIWGQDFSRKMIDIASAKMPEAHLFEGDFSEKLAEPILRHSYDYIIATYSLHHLTDERKVALIRSLWTLLNDGGSILIGDVAFESRGDLERCRREAGDEWDEDEIYFVYDELKEALPELQFERISFCSGVLSLSKRRGPAGSGRQARAEVQ